MYICRHQKLAERKRRSSSRRNEERAMATTK